MLRHAKRCKPCRGPRCAIMTPHPSAGPGSHFDDLRTEELARKTCEQKDKQN